MRALGISAFHRDAAAALVVDGEVVAAIQEERFTRKPGESAFPRRSIRHVLDSAGITAQDLDAVVFAEKPLRKFERILVTHLQAFPSSVGGFGKSMFLWLGDRLWMRGRIAKELEIDLDKVLFCEHGMAHATAGLFAAPTDRAALLVLDDVGEWASTVLATGDANGVKLLAELHYPDSLGMLASAFAQHLGLTPGEEEGALAHLAAGGEPRFLEALGKLVPTTANGGFHVDSAAFPFTRDGESLCGRPLVDVLGEARQPGSPWCLRGADKRHADVAASAQALLEERALGLVRSLHERAPEETWLSVSGLLARNPRLLARLAEDGPFQHLSVTPYEDDGGSALGAALLGGQARSSSKAVSPFLGPEVEDQVGGGSGARRVEASTLAERIASGAIVGWAQGRLEFGSASRGGRALLGAAKAPDAASRLLRAVQRDDPWQAVTILVPAERADELLEVPRGCEQPLRLGQLAVRTRAALRQLAPSAVDADGRALVQVVDAAGNPALHALLGQTAGCGEPLLLLADLRLRGAALVRSEADAVDLFERSALDALMVGEHLYERA